MSSTIKVYPKGTEEYRRLETVASELTKRSASGFTYSVDDTYFDHGQGWRWTTIIVHTSNGDSWQVLCPRDHERIIYTDDLRGVINDIKKDLYRDAAEKPSLLTNVKCYYTGGGIYVYSALFNGEVWLFGGLDNYFGSYDLSGEVINDMEEVDFDSHVKTPSIPYPTWNDILESIRENCSDSTYTDCERILRNYNPGPMMWNSCMEADPPAPGSKENPIRLDPNTTHEGRMCLLADIVDVFDDFLDAKGIDIPNEDRDDDPCASNIYGCDFANLCDGVEEILIRYGILNKEE